MHANTAVDSETYSEMVLNWLIPSLLKDGVSIDEIRLMQDNAPIHISRLTKEKLLDKINLLSAWPPLSPDLNIIENVWSFIKRDLRQLLRKQTFKKNESFFDFAVKSFQFHANRFIRNLYKSIVKRLEIVVQKNGDRIGY